jgi:hypothetical protein
MTKTAPQNAGVPVGPRRICRMSVLHSTAADKRPMQELKAAWQQRVMASGAARAHRRVVDQLD